MNRSFAYFAALLPAMSLGLLVMQWSSRSSMQVGSLGSLQQVAIPPLDPMEALQEIEQLRLQRGSVLANSALEHDPELIQPDFKFEYDRSAPNRVLPVSAETTVLPTPNIVQQLRQTARLLDEQANAKEDADDYEAETLLRNLAQQLRHTAKTIQR